MSEEFLYDNAFINYKDNDKDNDKDNYKELKKNNKELLILLSRSDSLLDHSIEECGNCFYRNNLAQVAREMLEKGDTGEGAAKRWEEETEKRWQNSKYYKLWVEEKKAGRDPYKAFEEKGWIV